MRKTYDQDKFSLILTRCLIEMIESDKREEAYPEIFYIFSRICHNIAYWHARITVADDSEANEYIKRWEDRSKRLDAFYKKERQLLSNF